MGHYRRIPYKRLPPFVLAGDVTADTLAGRCVTTELSQPRATVDLRKFYALALTVNARDWLTVAETRDIDMFTCLQPGRRSGLASNLPRYAIAVVPAERVELSTFGT